MSGTSLTPGSIKSGQRVSGIIPGEAVTLTAVDYIANDFIEISYRTDDGSRGEQMLSADSFNELSVVQDADAALKFDADPTEFKLVSEALRIKYAALYDPMAAVNSSDVEPLPHQIRAVYEELLPRIPLRFLLADDPGAGKTIMAGLYLKELILRSDCERAIIVAPGGLVEQWKEELSQKFDLRFEIFNRQMVDDAEGRNVFAEHPYLITRMDQLSRNEDLLEQLSEVTWDVAVVDEAHRMSAHFSGWAGEIKETQRFKLGRLLSETAHNFLLMTATPHAGKEEDFQLFMSLLDRDRFEGQYRQGVHRTDTFGLMRRMVKEDLLTFEGKPLFPERRAYTVEYELSLAERDLYEEVTDYVRTEMGRAERISSDGDKKRGNNVGFALTVLQRRLASSPEAILRSLERRRDRLQQKLLDMQRMTAEASIYEETLPQFSVDDFDYLDDEVTEEERSKFEEEIDQVVDLATAARTIPELQAEIQTLEQLVLSAKRVRHLGDDKKWMQLSSILDEQILSSDVSGNPRKIIIFTEHRDTLDYLERKISKQLGKADAVITIHGGTRREDRKIARESFTHNPETVVLLATDAAGEGLNLQRAHLMVNYDLPWNPNRIEQRFGRIHRIGQREVCHLWNMVAKDTREGDVFSRLLSKIEQMSKAYNGNLFNVLGEADAFQERSLRDLLIEAIRYGDQPERKKELEQVIDAGVMDGAEELIHERALHPEMFNTLDLSQIRKQMELARERKLQPSYIAAFFIPAFERLGGQLRKRETGRYEIMRVPARVIYEAKKINRWTPVASQYERVTFEIQKINPEGLQKAELLAPGHPLLQAVIEVTIADLQEQLKKGTVFVDRQDKQLTEPALLFTVEQKVQSAEKNSKTLSHYFDYAFFEEKNGLSVYATPPYLDYDPPNDSEIDAIRELIGASEWLKENHEKNVRATVYRNNIQVRLEELRLIINAEVQRTKIQVRERLLAEINHWDREHNRLDALERAGTVGRMRASAALSKARSLEQRLESRLKELDSRLNFRALPSVIRSSALVIPSALLSTEINGSSSVFAKETDEVERRAVDAVLAAEKTLGRHPVEMPKNYPGYDVRSTDNLDQVYFIEVKGRIEGSDTFTISANQVNFAQTHSDRHRLALVTVSKDDSKKDQLRYVTNAFSHFETASTTRSLNEVFDEYWVRGGEPL